MQVQKDLVSHQGLDGLNERKKNIIKNSSQTNEGETDNKIFTSNCSSTASNDSVEDNMIPESGLDSSTKAPLSS